MTELKPRTRAMLAEMHSRREHVISDHKHPITGYWVITRRRVRTLHDYLFLSEHPRTPKAARAAARRWIGRAVNEARRWEGVAR